MENLLKVVDPLQIVVVYGGLLAVYKWKCAKSLITVCRATIKGNTDSKGPRPVRQRQRQKQWQWQWPKRSKHGVGFGWEGGSPTETRVRNTKVRPQLFHNCSFLETLCQNHPFLDHSCKTIWFMRQHCGAWRRLCLVSTKSERADTGD